MTGSIIILFFFLIGLIAGICGINFGFENVDNLNLYALYMLMFFVGIVVGTDQRVWDTLKKINLRIIAVPAIVIIGTLLGTLICSLFLRDISSLDAMAIGSGFGYYSLSSILISKIRDETIGVIALIANIAREIFTLVATPLLVKYFGNIAPIASAGATSMDTTLPIITKYSGKDYAIISVFSGVALTILVPSIITLIYKFM